MTAPAKLRICYVVHNTTRKGGAYFRGQGFAKPMARLGHEVTVLAIAPSEKWRMAEKRIENFRLVESPDLLWGIGRTGWDPWDTARRTAWLVGEEFDVVHTVDTRPAVSLPALAAQRLAGSVWVADWTDWWGRGGATSERSGWAVKTFVGPLEEFFEERPRPLADGTIVISRALGQRAVALGCKPDTMLYLPPGADPDAIRTEDPATAKARLGLEAGTRYVGYLGNIYQRDADMLFAALAELKTPDVKLLMIGEAKYTWPAHLDARIVRTGHVPFPKMLDALSACEVLALPLSDTIANRGRWPSKLNEYVAVGRPTVASAVGDVAELFAEHEIGWTCAPDAAAMAQALDFALVDPGEAQRRGDVARAMAQASYSQEAVGHRLEDFYRRLVSARRSRPGTA